MSVKKIDPVCKNEVKKALDLYRKEVEESGLKPDTKRTYLRHAETFVRWLHDDFQPGSGNKGSFFILAVIITIGLLTAAPTSFAGSEEDAARIEMKFEIQKLAHPSSTVKIISR